jgi:ferredoxin
VNIKDQVYVEYAGLRGLFEVLRATGYQTVGPRLRDGAIVYDELTTVDDLPAGWTDDQEGGKYRLSQLGDGAIFGYAVGPHSWKKFLFPPATRQWMTHKLATWIDQFGTSGCVGCGRCITWCPVAIDITEEVRAIRATGAARALPLKPKGSPHES